MDLALAAGHTAVVEVFRAYFKSKGSLTSSHPRVHLMKAIQFGDVEWCERIVSEGCDVDSVLWGCSPCTPMHYALALNQQVIAAFFHEQGANARCTTCSALGFQGWSTLHQCAFYGNLGLYTSIINRDPEFPKTAFPIHPLHVAIANCQLDIARAFLMGNGGGVKPCGVDVRTKETTWPWMLSYDLNSDRFGPGATALHIACECHNLPAVKLLIEHSANVNATTDFDITPLHSAVRQRHLALVEYLISNGANVNVQDWRMHTPAMYAADIGDYACFTRLVRFGANIDFHDQNGRQALHIAASAGHAQIVAYLWSRDCKLETLAGNGVNAGILGFKSRNPSMRSFLLNCGADLSYFSPCFGNIIHSVLWGRLNRGTRQLKQIIRRMGPDRAFQMVNHQSKACPSPLYIAVGSNVLAALHLFLDAGAQVNAEGGPAGTALMVAAEAGRLEAARILVNAGASMTARKGDEVLSAVKAAKHHPKIVRWFLVDRFTERRSLCLTPHWVD